ncbi:MAG TPA: cell division protein FtsA [Aquificaceae bacterium]|jgi:cell division protein FtsA|nr:cell division protein FtsA [Aquificaceae bacterium]QWK12567.1 MAG: cell division protein FtsA [Aquificota bacterium]HAV40457.1 cell division protein FtsA [Aquificaceae bacterium]HCO39269.1 cell division protein FtsA [Aquificaceae bacterium]
MKLITSLDIGTSKVVALVGEVDSYGDLHVIGIGESPSKGIDKGYVTRLDLAVNSVLTAIKEAQEMAGSKISNVVLGISGPTLKSQNEKDTISISSQPIEIDYTHIERLIERAIMRSKEEGYEVLDAIPRKFILDDQEGVIDPVGLLGSRISAEVHVVKIGSSILKNTEKVVLNAGMEVLGKFLSPLASAEAVLTPEEKEEGVLMIDMGAGLTDFVVFLEGSILVTGCLPIGGSNITKDIAHFMKINVEQAERIKIENGFAYADLVNEAERVKIKPRGEEKEVSISRKQLAEVIQIRLEEIMEKLSDYLNQQGVNLDSLHAGIVITGGSAKLAGMREFLERYFDLPVRIGYPMGVIGLKEKVQDPAYATSVGLIKLAHKSFIFDKRDVFSKGHEKEKKNSTFKNFVDRLMSFFRDII